MALHFFGGALVCWDNVRSDFLLKITKKVLQKLMEFKIVRSIPGRMRLKSKSPSGIYKDAQEYDEYLRRAILLLPGIEKVEFNYNIGTALIEYKIEKTYEGKILNWINKIIEIGIENSEVIVEYWQRDIEYLEKILEQQLIEEVQKF